MVFLIELLMSIFYQQNSVIGTQKPSLLEFLMILILLNDRFYTVPFLERQFFPIFNRLFLLLQSWSWVYHNGDTEQLLTHSSVPKSTQL